MQFISKDAKLSSDSSPLSDLNVSKIFKVGADVLGVRMDLNQMVKISLPAIPQIGYRILTSED